MVVQTLVSKISKAVGGAAAAAMMIAATPAAANSSANADIAAPLRAAQGAKPATGANDEEFSKLFNSWQQFEESGVPALAAVAEATSQAGLTAASKSKISAATMTSVSIPSRMPVDDARLTSSYGMRDHPVTGGRRAHKGVDLAQPTGTPIYATADGVVSKASWYGSYGLYVSLEHGGEIQTRYAHMSRLNVADGQRVKKGDVIGFVGSTGRSTGPHLHYEVRVRGDAVNPVPYMTADHLASASVSQGAGGPE